MTSQSESDQLLNAAEELFYERGFQAVGMDTLRAASGLPLKRIYSLFNGKDAIAVAMLDRRDERWHASLADRVNCVDDPAGRILAIFDWLFEWLASEGYRGCAWINAFGELGGNSPEVADAVRRHKARLWSYIKKIVTEAGSSESEANAVFLLVEGSMVTSGICGNADAALQAKAAVSRLIGT